MLGLFHHHHHPSTHQPIHDQQIADAKVYIGQDSRQEGPFHIKVSGELATELKEAGTIDIFEMRGKEEEHSQVEFEVCRADAQGRNLTLLEELQTKEARDKALAQERKEAREKEATVRQEGSYSRQLHSLMTPASTDLFVTAGQPASPWPWLSLRPQ